MNDKNEKLWVVAQAELVKNRLEKDQKSVVFETGYGPSGLPHFGTFAEVARTSYIRKAFMEIAPDIKSRLIAFSDDRDGLRKLPPNIPNHSMLKEHMGKPLSLIPDPFGEQKTFADYMNTRLKSFLDQFGFDYEYYSSTDFYLSGGLDESLKLVAKNYDKVKSIFTSTITEEKREDWSPFMPICPSCLKLYSTVVEEIDVKNNKVKFSCSKDSDVYKACGYKGEVPLTGKYVKMGWKVDWAARWIALKVDFEPHGEDLTESVRVSQKICQALGYKGPITFKYELFLDENGLKISKTKGNGLSMEQWLKYSPLEALLFFLTSNPNKPRKMGPAILPKLVDDYLTAVKSDEPIDLNNPIYYVNLFKRDKDLHIKEYPSYQLLVNIIEALGQYDVNLLLEYSKNYSHNLSSDAKFLEIAKKAIDFVKDNKQENKEMVSTDLSFMPQFNEWHSYLNSIDKIEAESSQKRLYDIAMDNKLQLKNWFKFLYNVYLNKNEGPRLGQLFQLLGINKTKELTIGFLKNAKN